ncbi:MAG: T9SS type A sorting domain-containing protein [Bacteroidales bacterium]
MRNLFTLGLFVVAGSLSAQTAVDSIIKKVPGGIPLESLKLIQFWNEVNTQNQETFTVIPPYKIRYKELVKAPQDGCYYGIGDPRNLYEPTGMTQEQCITCEEEGGKIKKNQSYVWGLTQGNGQIFYGVNTNYLCNTISEINKQGSGMIPLLPPYENKCWTCEYGKSNTAGDEPMWGDWQQPRIYHYDPITKQNKDVTPEGNEVLNYTYGLRSAGTLNDVSFIAGPNKDKGISMYAYNNTNGNFIGAHNMFEVPGFEGKTLYNIRRWLVVNNVLYCGAEYKSDKSKGGVILKWTGNAENPFSFAVVGWTKGGAAELVFLNNRIYVGTWPASIAQSPVMEGTEFQTITTDPSEGVWPTIFDYGKNYDPDLIQSNVASNGGMCVYNGQIYFGTMHMTWGNHFMIPQLYRVDASDTQALLQAWLGSYRAAALFRLTDFPDKEGAESYNVELLYGEEKLPAYNFQTKKWEIKPTKMGAPLYGKSGFNNMFNNYIWSMSVLNDKLYIGTMDYTDLIVPQIESLEQYLDVKYPPYLIPILYQLMSHTQQQGFNLMCIAGSDEKAKLINHNGFNNESAYGIRNMITIDDKMYIGTGNPLNLHEQGGWQLFELTEGDPYIEPQITWKPEKMLYGDTISQNQLNAQVLVNNEKVEGEYTYTIQQRPVTDITTLRPGQYNLRLNFKPADESKYAPITEKTTLKVDKANLNVIAENITIDADEAIPTEFPVKMEGFLKEEGPEILDEQPRAYIETTDPLAGSEYPILVSGGKSDLYNFKYVNGTLVIRIPSNIEAQAEKKFKLYPIPFNDMITIESEQPIKKITISNLTGKIVLEIADPDKQLNLSTLIPSTYLMRIETANGVIVRKITKTN